MTPWPHGTREEQIEGAKGLRIFVRSIVPENVRAVVAICHGVKSHSGYYGWAAAQLAARGIAVYALDLHGRGKSDGDRYFLDHIGDYLADVHALLCLARSRTAAVPVFLLGHSAGGVVSSVYALEHQAELAGFICESFAFQVYAPEFALAVLKGLSHLAPHAHVLFLRNSDFSRDAAAVKGMDEDPLIAGEAQPTRTVAELVRADERLKREFSQIALPLLILHGTADKVTRPSGSQLFFDTAGAIDKTLHMYEGHAHDLLNDQDRERVMSDILSWLDRQIASGQQGHTLRPDL